MGETRDNLIKMVEAYVSENIHLFHEARINKLSNLKLSTLLKKKNPYLYRAKDLNTPQEIVESLADAFLSSAEETMFGDWMEQLAIFVAAQVYGGRKSTSEGVDIEMDKDGVHYIVSVKSGPNWSNSSSMNKLVQNFLKAKRIFATSGNKMPCEAVEGCCYGRGSCRKDSHIKLCGEAFWKFLSGSDTLYTDIVEPLGADARVQNEQYAKKYKQKITLFTKEFANEYCLSDGCIDWDKIVRMNSGAGAAK